MKTAVITITESGQRTAKVLTESFSDTDHFHNDVKGGLSDLTAELFTNYDGLIFIMATGIVVRMIAPLLTDKYHDPAVVVVDDARRYAISLVSGHEGGANRLTWKTASVLGAEPVVTTATETNKRSVIGIGCRRGVSSEAVQEAVLGALGDVGGEGGEEVSAGEVRCAATIDLKRDEQGLIDGLNELDIPLLFFSKERINSFGGAFAENEVSVRQLGVKAVAEPCALLAGQDAELILSKSIYGDVTIAVAREKSVYESRREGEIEEGKVNTDKVADKVAAGKSRGTDGLKRKGGKLSIIGIGPGNSEEISPRAVKALGKAELVVGYTRYIRFIEEFIAGKEIYTSGMRKETERAGLAVDAAREGKTVAVVSGGDAGVYGLAGLVLELLHEGDAEHIDVEIIPGITAATSAASVLGAPLMHDFSVISLSDLLTDPELIRERLRAAAAADFVTVIYNPKSKKREKLFYELPDIFLPHRREDTPVGIVCNAGREEEERFITTLSDLPDAADNVQMRTTLIIGNSSTSVKGGFIITPRGYKL